MILILWPSDTLIFQVQLLFSGYSWGKLGDANWPSSPAKSARHWGIFGAEKNMEWCWKSYFDIQVYYWSHIFACLIVWMLFEHFTRQKKLPKFEGLWPDRFSDFCEKWTTLNALSLAHAHALPLSLSSYLLPYNVPLKGRIHKMKIDKLLKENEMTLMKRNIQIFFDLERLAYQRGVRCWLYYRL